MKRYGIEEDGERFSIVDYDAVSFMTAEDGGRLAAYRIVESFKTEARAKAVMRAREAEWAELTS